MKNAKISGLIQISASNLQHMPHVWKQVTSYPHKSGIIFSAIALYSRIHQKIKKSGDDDQKNIKMICSQGRVKSN